MNSHIANMRFLPNPLTPFPDSLDPRKEGGIFNLTPTPLPDTRSSLGEGQMLENESPPSQTQTAFSFACAGKGAGGLGKRSLDSVGFMTSAKLRVILIGTLMLSGSTFLRAQTPAPAHSPAVNKPGVSSPTISASETAKPAASAVVIQLRKELPGSFDYQFVPKNGAPSAPAPLPGTTGADNIIALPLPANFNPADIELQVMDYEHGDIARIPVTIGTVLSLTESSFNRICSVTVPVQSKGKGVAATQVSMSSKSGKFHQSVLLLTSSNGTAVFHDVPIGEPVTVSVEYGAHSPKSQTDTLTRDHPADGFHWQTFDLDWPDVRTIALSTQTVTPSVKDGNHKSGDTPTAAIPSTGLNPFNLIFSLLVLGGIIYAIFWASNQGHLNAALKKLGIEQIPAAEDAPNPFKESNLPPLQPITDATAEPVGGAAVSGVGFAAPSAGPRLIATAGVYSGNVYPVQGGNLDIGRDPSNTIAMPDDTNVSRRHAALQWLNGSGTIVDNGSSNGTFLNGVRIAPQAPQAVRPGDEIQIGQTRFRLEA